MLLSDRGWLGEYPPPDDADAHIPIGSARVYGDGMDLTILTFGNGLRMSLRVAGRLTEYGIAARVVDLRFLAPLPIERMWGVGKVTASKLHAHGIDAIGQIASAEEGFLVALLGLGLDRRRYD